MIIDCFLSRKFQMKSSLYDKFKIKTVSQFHLTLQFWSSVPQAIVNTKSLQQSRKPLKTFMVQMFIAGNEM